MLNAGFAIVENQGCLEVRVLTNLTVTNAAAVRAAVLRAWEDGGRPQRLEVDLAEARRIDSSGLGALLEIAHRIEDAGVRLVLRGLNQAARRVLDRTGLGMLFQITDAGAPALHNSFHG